jgi:hypothetical protein
MICDVTGRINQLHALTIAVENAITQFLMQDGGHLPQVAASVVVVMIAPQEESQPLPGCALRQRQDCEQNSAFERCEIDSPSANPSGRKLAEQLQSEPLHKAFHRYCTRLGETVRAVP